MENNHTDEKVRTLLAEILQLPETTIADGLMMKDVDSWDSLKHMELVMLLEQTFNLQFSFDEIVAMQSVREIKRVLKAKEVSG